jgi:hypothetical protein
MAGWPDIEELKVKETSEPAIRYCEGLVYGHDRHDPYRHSGMARR